LQCKRGYYVAKCYTMDGPEPCCKRIERIPTCKRGYKYSAEHKKCMRIPAPKPVYY
jgi:hypothetical protein